MSPVKLEQAMQIQHMRYKSVGAIKASAEEIRYIAYTRNVGTGERTEREQRFKIGGFLQPVGRGNDTPAVHEEVHAKT